MSILTLDTTYFTILQALGNVQETLEAAIRHYALTQIGDRIATLQHEILTIQAQYGLPYAQFYDRVTTDEQYVIALRSTHPTWERDFNAWGYYVEELAEWLGRLTSIEGT